jgi:hypothetical protein
MIEAVHNVENFEKASHLLIYSENDPMNQKTAIETVKNTWTEQNTDFQVQKWKKSAHAAHLLRHEQDYLKAFNSFVNKIYLK